MRKIRRKGYVITALFLLLSCTLLTACDNAEKEPAAAPVKTVEPDFSNIDYAASPYKHLNNGGLTDDERMPYNIDAITGATVTVEGPAVVTSIPLSMRELENRNDGLSRGIYTDSTGDFIYEGLDLYYLLNEMVDGDNGIILTEAAYSVRLKNSNRATIAEFTVDEVKKAHDEGRPILLAYGMGTPDGELCAPFVFDAANPAENSEGYISELENDDGCLRLVYDLDSYGSNPDYTRFINVAYAYVCEETEPGFKHSADSGSVYGSGRYTDYLISFRGEALGYEAVFTVAELEALVSYDESGALVEGGVGYSDFYSLANNAYWYVNEFEGLDLYKLLLYLGMDSAEDMGTAAARTTLVGFIADDGVISHESFSVDTLSYPDVFGFYEKNSGDLGDGSFIPTNADLVDTGYPVLLAYGVNRYPYTITKADEGYMSGLSNSGGPMRVVFGKTQYSHANGSNQVQYLREVIVGNDLLYNTHKYSDVKAHSELAGELLTVAVTSEDGQALIDRELSVGELEDIIYGGDVAGNVKKAAHVKQLYEIGGSTDAYEGIRLEHLLMEVLGLPGKNGTITFTGGGDELTLNLDSLFREGSSAIIAFAKNGAPLVADESAGGYIVSRKLKPAIEGEPAEYSVQNSGGPLMIILPDDNAFISNVTGITIELIPDSYAHIAAEYSGYAASTVRFYGEGLERELEYTVGDIESMQTKAKTLDFSLPTGEERYRGVSVYELFTQIGIKSNAGDVTVYSSDGTSATFSLSALKKQNYRSFAGEDREPLFVMLAYGSGTVGGDTLTGLPLTSENGGPLRLIVPQTESGEDNAAAFINDVVAIEVTANEIDTWGHKMSDIYGDFLDYEFTLTIKNDDSEYTQVFTVAELEDMTDLIVRDSYSVLDIGQCEGVNIWKLIQHCGAGIDGIDDPVAITVYAEDGYKNDLLSVFYREGFELGVANENGDRKPLIIAYAINGLPLVDSESHEGYTGLSGNTAGPLRVVAETNQGASVKYVNKLVVTVPGSGAIGG